MISKLINVTFELKDYDELERIYTLSYMYILEV